MRNTDGDRVDEGNSSVSANTLQVTVPTDLPEGTYIATYRVLSGRRPPGQRLVALRCRHRARRPVRGGRRRHRRRRLGGRRSRRPLRHLPDRPAGRRPGVLPRLPPRPAGRPLEARADRAHLRRGRPVRHRRHDRRPGRPAHRAGAQRRHRRRGPPERAHRPARLGVGRAAHRARRRPPLDRHQPAAGGPGAELLRRPRRHRVVRPVGPQHRSALPVAGVHQRHRPRHRRRGVARRPGRAHHGAVPPGPAPRALHRPDPQPVLHRRRGERARPGAGRRGHDLDRDRLGEGPVHHHLRPAGAGEDGDHPRRGRDGRLQPVPAGPGHRRRGRGRPRRGRRAGRHHPGAVGGNRGHLVRRPSPR